MNVLADTSVLIAVDVDFPEDVSISAASLAELHYGLLMAKSIEQRANRAQRLAAIEATMDALPLDSLVCREWGRLAATVQARGGKPRRRVMDLMIAATANVHGLELLTFDTADLAIIEDLVDFRNP